VIITVVELDRSQNQAESETFERVAKPGYAEEDETMRLDQAARSIFSTEFVSAFFLAMRYFFKPRGRGATTARAGPCASTST
jgi:hypothetical protein